MSLYVSAVIAALITVSGTAYATLWVSRRLRAEEEARRILDAINVIVGEIADNREAVELCEKEQISARNLRDDKWWSASDWRAQKRELAALGRINRDLWGDLQDAYAEIERVLRTGGAPLGGFSSTLGDLERRLESVRIERA